MSSETARGSGQSTSKTNMSLDDAIRFATELIKPLADVNKHIHDNISMVKDKQDETATVDPHRLDLSNFLTTPRAVLVAERLEYPMTVCGSKKCTGSTKSATGENQVIYKQICHEDCTITGVPTGCKNQEELTNCVTMHHNDDPDCFECSCSWREHMHITYTTFKNEEVVPEPNIQKLVETSSDKSEIVKIFNESSQGKIKILEDEQKAVTQMSAQLETFLEQNNTSAGSDVTAGYMDHLIDVQQTLVTLGNNRQLLESLMTTRTSYNQEVNALKEATKTGTTAQVLITPDNILESVEKLCCLSETGDQIRRTIDAVTSAGISGRIASVGVDLSGLNLVSTKTDSLQS